MAAVGRFDKQYVRIGEQRRTSFRQPNERIVDCAKNQRPERQCDQRRARWRRDSSSRRHRESRSSAQRSFVELRSERTGPMPLAVNVRKQLRLAAKTPHQPAQKMPFIDAVHWLMQSIGACRKINGRTHRRHGAKRRLRYPTRQQASAPDFRPSSSRPGPRAPGRSARQSGEPPRPHRREAGVIERRRQLIGIAAVAHVHADHVHPAVQARAAMPLM